MLKLIDFDKIIKIIGCQMSINLQRSVCLNYLLLLAQDLFLFFFHGKSKVLSIIMQELLFKVEIVVLIACVSLKSKSTSRTKNLLGYLCGITRGLVTTILVFAFVFYLMLNVRLQNKSSSIFTS